MAEGENTSRSFESSNERFKYIGFEVFPGKPGNIFKSDEERRSLIEKVMRRFSRSQGEVRDRCTLMEERISGLEKILLTIAAVMLIISLFLPWFSGYYEIVTTRQVSREAETAAVAAGTDETPADSAAMMAAADPAATAETAENALAEVATEGTGEMAAAAGTEQPADSGAVTGTVEGGTERMMTVTEVTHDNKSLSGIGAIAALGTYGSMVFSSGFILVISGILMIAFFLGCIIMAVLNLYVLYGVKKPSHDEYALYVKRMLRYNWIPVFIWLAVFVLSFIGAGYGFNPEGMLKQVGDSYGVAAFIGLSSVGMYLSLGVLLVLALKGKEI
jgi:preprotein translocase subunit SecG